MDLVIKEIVNKDFWETFLAGCAEKTFLQSWNWGESQKKEGNTIWRWGIYSDHELTAVALVVKISARRGTFLFLPHGPVVKNPESQALNYKILESLMAEVKKTAKKEGADFIRISPILERNEKNISIFKKLGLRNASTHMHPEVTWELDISNSEEEILAGMRKTTRYLIKQAQKTPNIQIIKSENIQDLDLFNKIYERTASRHKFVPFSLKYLQREFSSFVQDKQIMIFEGKYQDKLISTAIFVFWQDAAFYHHSGSLTEYSKIPVSYLLQWEAIKEAKRRGCKLYNFWGIAEKNWKLEIVPPWRDPAKGARTWKFGEHPWAGLSLFKMGFGGRRKEYVKTQDLALSPKYWLISYFEKLRRLKRGL